ncbi:hypothetical protein [Burkholderia glumae]|uniref:hypothetical protein n=1 Tax=Burkholderia glumae TaxID=337 RepID=UPI002151A886|nr:hypothetical protein [Burkholderia glumae]UVS99065.1 hypothetical protein EFP19_26035 [Burkholderia glumae]
MAIRKNVVLALTSATASYHVIGGVTLDLLGGTTVASINSYVSEDAYRAGKQPLQLSSTISVKGVPEQNEGAVPYIHRRLIEAEPDEGRQAADRPMTYNALDRYMLAGGEIVA